MLCNVLPSAGVVGERWGPLPEYRGRSGVTGNESSQLDKGGRTEPV